MADPKNTRYMPERQNYQNHQQWQDAVNLHTMAYNLQDAHEATNKKVEAVSKPKPMPAPFTGEIQGVKIAALTQPGISHTSGGVTTTTGGLQNGYTLRYNSSSGQFEFGT
jgi:hypothetical protein